MIFAIVVGILIAAVILTGIWCLGALVLMVFKPTRRKDHRDV